MTFEKLSYLILIKTGYDVESKSRKVPFVDVRTMFIALSRHYTLGNNQEVADYLEITEGAVRYYIEKHFENIRHSHPYRYNFQEIENELKKLN